MNDMVAFNPSKLPARLKDRKGEMSALAKSLAGESNNSKRISIKGGVFRLMAGGKQIGKMDERHMDVVVVNAAPKVSRVLYLKKWDGDAPAGPDCWSNDGDKPDASIKEPQHSNCADCEQNVSGSGEGTSRKCRFQQRIAVVLPDQMDGDVLQLAVPGASLFGKGVSDDRPLKEYARFLSASGIDPDEVVTQISFDTDSESPKLFFKAKRWLTDEEHEIAVQQGATKDAQDAVVMTVAQRDGDAEVAPPAMEGARPKKAKPAPEVEDDAEEEAPAPKPKAKAKPEPVVEDEVDEPEVRKPAKAAAAPAAKKSSLANMAAEWDDED